MLFGNYRFFCRFQTEAILPPFKGSTFRGVFGRALKSVVCALKRQACETCLLQNQCIYPQVFENLPSAKAPAAGNVVPPPHPFVIEPPSTRQTRFQKGDTFDFNLLLLGPVNRNIVYFIYALEKMGAMGVGKYINGSRGRFSLEKVKAGRRILYLPAEEKLRDVQPAVDITLDHAVIKSPVQWIKISFETPLRIKYQSRFINRLPFHVLVRAMLRRASSLFDCFSDGEPELDYRGLVKRAESVKIESADIRWHDRRRYSARQETGMMMGGLIGTVTYRGQISEFMPIIDFCSKVHLGKQTAFGLGKFHTETRE